MRDSQPKAPLAIQYKITNNFILVFLNGIVNCNTESGQNFRDHITGQRQRKSHWIDHICLCILHPEFRNIFKRNLDRADRLIFLRIFLKQSA